MIDWKEHLDPARLKEANFCLAEFWATWCIYSRLLRPKTRRLAEYYENRVLVGRVEAEGNSDVLQALGIEFLPAVVFIERGRAIHKWYGDVPLQAITTVVNRHV